MNEKNIKKMSSNILTLWEGKISFPYNNLGKGSILPVRLDKKNKAIILNQNADILWTPPDDLAQIIANFLKKDIFIGSMITAKPKGTSLLSLSKHSSRIYSDTISRVLSKEIISGS